METVITISGADKAGSLAGLVVFLNRKGYAVKGQKITELPSGARLIKVRLGLAQLDKERLSAEIKALDPLYSLLSVTFEDGSRGKSQSPAQSAADLIREMARQFPGIVMLVRAYGGGAGRPAPRRGQEAGRFPLPQGMEFRQPSQDANGAAPRAGACAGKVLHG